MALRAGLKAGPLLHPETPRRSELEPHVTGGSRLLKVPLQCSRTAARVLADLFANARLRPLGARLARAVDLHVINVSLPQRIGHLVMELDAFLKDYRLEHGRFPVAILIEPGSGGFANAEVVAHIARYVYIVPRDARGIALEAIFKEHGFGTDTTAYAVAMYATAKAFDVCRRWGDRGPLFSLDRQDAEAARAYLRDQGMPDDAWFVCMHARGGGFSPHDEHWHLHRNVAIADYDRAVDAIRARGGWCIRMGDRSMQPIVPREGVIDYAVSDQKSAALDLGLIALCRFFLGCASGLYNVAVMFGRPSVLVNTTPLSAAYGLLSTDLAVPQKIHDGAGRELTVRQVFDTKIANFRLAEEFRNSGLVATNISPQDVLEAVEEMLGRLDGSVVDSAEDLARQEAFRSHLRPGHYAFGNRSNLGRAYLRRCMPVPDWRTPSTATGPARPDAANPSVRGPDAMPAETDRQPIDYSQFYDANYYASHCGPVAYDRANPVWPKFFGTMAEEIIRLFHPRRVFDAGCAYGFLVEALWDRGVVAHGRDISDFAISQVRQDMRPHCSVGSLLDPIADRYDLITCIEVLEHLSEADGEVAIANLTRASDVIVFSSSPSDFDEPTHINVQPPLYWIEAFARHGFKPLATTALLAITPHAIAFARAASRPDADLLTAAAEIVHQRIAVQALQTELRALKSPPAGPDEGARFDPDYYARINPDVMAAGCDPLEHFVQYGRLEGRYPNAKVAEQIEAILAANEAAMPTPKG